MEEQLISFETAKLAKEKGYINHDCKQYDIKGLSAIKGYVNNPTAAPTQSLLQKWLREIHNIKIRLIQKNIKYSDKYWVFIQLKLNKEIRFEGNTYEKALEIGLQKGLKLI